jgi:hypothetical protein
MLEHARSGLSIAAFCHREGLRPWTFRWWRLELARRDRQVTIDRADPAPGPSTDLVYWAGDGFALWYRRLEKGTCRFPIPSEAEAIGIPVKAADLLMLLEGVGLDRVKRRPRYVRQPA